MEIQCVGPEVELSYSMHASVREAGQSRTRSCSEGFDANIYWQAWWPCCYSDPDEDSLHARMAESSTACICHAFHLAGAAAAGHPIKI